MSHRILVVDSVLSEEALAVLKAQCQVQMIASGSPEELIHEINHWHAQAVCIRDEFISQEVWAQCPSLNVVQTTRLRFDHIDLDAASAEGKLVLNVPDIAVASVAEHVIALVLGLSRRLKVVHRQAVQGGMPYPYPAEFRLQRELEGKNFLIVGLDETGKSLIPKAAALDLQVTVYDPSLSKKQAQALGAAKADNLTSVLQQADYVTLHLPRWHKTYHLIDAQELAMMKTDAYLINVAAGGLVNETALVDALQQNRIGGAGFDVLESEPLPYDHPLLQFDNVIVTPRCAEENPALSSASALTAAQSLLSALNERPLSALVNRKQLELAGRLPTWC